MVNTEVKTETTPIIPLVQEPTSKPEQKSSAAATATALSPPQISEDGGDELDVHNECVFSDSFKFVN